MKGWFDKYDSYDDSDAYKIISKRFDSYAQGGGGSSSHMSQNPETILKELALIAEMIEELFAEKGLSIRSFTESNRRGR
jgi:hypothetical protein